MHELETTKSCLTNAVFWSDLLRFAVRYAVFWVELRSDLWSIGGDLRSAFQ